jgi:hypothetical protein
MSFSSVPRLAGFTLRIACKCNAWGSLKPISINISIFINPYFQNEIRRFTGDSPDPLDQHRSRAGSDKDLGDYRVRER